MTPQSGVDRAMEWIYRLMPWLLVWHFLTEASEHYVDTGKGWEALLILVVAWVTYDYGKERGQRQMADDLVRAFRKPARRGS